MIRLNVFIQVSDSNRAAVLEAAKELVACSLQDKGCIAYDIFESATRKDDLRNLGKCRSIGHARKSEPFCNASSKNTGIGFDETREVRLLKLQNP